MPTKNILFFLLGAGVGSTVVYFVVKKHYENLIDEEVESVRQYYKSQEDEDDEETDLSENEVKTLKKAPKLAKKDPKTAENDENYKEIIEKMNYGEFFPKKAKTEEVAVEADIPTRYVINGDAFAGDNRNEKVSLYYFEGDGVFMNIETDEVVPNGMDLIGEDNFERLGEFEEDVLYVRNDVTKTDYEVIQEHYAYAESEYREDQGDYE